MMLHGHGMKILLIAFCFNKRMQGKRWGSGDLNFSNDILAIWIFRR
jgi:hypothetical protein